MARGDSDWKKIWQAVGMALSAWEYVEEECALLFSVLVDSKSEAAYRAYGCIVSNSTRREMLQHSAESFFEIHKVIDGDRTFFYDLMKHLEKGSSIRNEIAHGAVLGIIIKKQSHEYFLLPPIYNSRKNTTEVATAPTLEPRLLRKAKYSYVTMDVGNFAQKFHWLRGALEAYRQALSNAYPLA